MSGNGQNSIILREQTVWDWAIGQKNHSRAKNIPLPSSTRKCLWWHTPKKNTIVFYSVFLSSNRFNWWADMNWSKEETDYLFQLCQDFDLRFVLIADRYAFGSVPRSPEDIKDRYYKVCRLLLRERGVVDPMELKKYDYQKGTLLLATMEVLKHCKIKRSSERTISRSCSREQHCRQLYASSFN